MLPQLKAERQLAAIEAASVPYMKPEAHDDLMRRLRDQLGSSASKAAPATPVDLAAMGIEVEYVSGEVNADD